MAVSSSDLLDSVNAAIQAILAGGQSYQLVDGTQVTRAGLASLMDMRSTLQQEVDAEAGNAVTFERTAYRERS